MNVLFVTYDFPFPTTSGGKNRAFHLLKYTAKKANVYLYSFVRDDYNPELNDEILNLGVKQIKVAKRKKLRKISNIVSMVINDSSIFQTLYYDKNVAEELHSIIIKEKIDIIHYESSYTGYYINKLKHMHVKQVLGTENIEYQLYLDYAKHQSNLFLKPFIYQQAQRLKKEELEMVKRSDAVTVITDSEAEAIEQLTNVKSEVVANGIEPDIYTYNFDKKIKNNILFVGNFTYFPNVDAMNFFCANVFEKLDSNITLTIIGKDSTKNVKFENERIIKKDFVEDIITEYRSADLLAFPIRIGGGTNFKILEAMSLGIPIVAHPDRMAGLNALAGTHFLKAVAAEDYVQQIKLIYNDEALREKITVNARNLVEKNFNWQKISNDLLSVWKKLK